MVGTMMWFKREPKPAEKAVENGVVGKLKRKKAVQLKPTRESSERETSTESDKEKRRHSDILDMKVSLERRDESDESLYESADCHSDAISASDDALPKLMKTPTMSKESLKIAITDEEVELAKPKKTHRKTMSLSNPLEMVRNFGDEWFETSKKDIDKNADKRKSKESLWSEEDRDSIHGSTVKLDQSRKNSKKEDKSQSNSRKSSSTDAPKARKTSKGSSVSALSLFRRKKTPTSMKPVEVVAEVVDRIETTEEILNYTKFFLEEEKRHTSACESKRIIETDTDDEPPTPKPGEHRRRPSRQTSRSKSKVRGKSQSVKVNTLRKTHSGTLKKSKKKGTKTPLSRSRQASIVDTPPMLKKRANSCKQNSWLFSASRGESRREGSADEQHPPETDLNTNDLNNKDLSDKDTSRAAPSVGRGVNRAESCRERDAPRRGKHRNASDPNRLTAHNNHDLEPGSVTAPSGSSSSSSLSSKSNESNTVTAERHASQSDWSDEDEPVIPAQWADSLPPQVLESLLLPPRIRKRQEVIHELIVSEASHVKWLKVLARIFHRPLEAQPTLLPAEELAALFPNLHSVREHHGRLYADLRTARQEAGPVVPLGPVADALLATLGASAYAPSLSRFCRGQRMALDALRERRRKHKELHQFLSAREQLPLCGRLQLRDLLACVWQRLTKYQLLLESIVKTVDQDEEDPDEVTRLRRALDVAKEVLQCVDAAIRTAENEHRLRTIQSKLEARAPSGAEWDEIRRLDLTTRTLRTEGELAIRTDNAKRVNVLALMLEDCLVLLQREGDRFLLKPFSQPNYSQLLSPIIRWDKVLFRPNAAERHTFFLMNINHVQMHELTASSAAEYATWVKHIQEAPLAKLAEFKGSFTSSHHASRSSDESGANVSRNPSDASERSAPIGGSEEAEPLLATPATPPAPPLPPPPPPPRPSLEREASTTTEPVPTETKVREPATVGSITRQSSSPPALEPAGAVRVREARRAHAAATALSPRERMRRLDARLAAALRDKSLVVAEVLGVPRDSYSQLAELAVADTLGQVESEGPAQPEDMHQLLLAAQTQATQLTEMAARALNVSETMAMATRASGLCDSCRSRGRRQDERREQWESFDADKDKEDSNLVDGMESDDMSTSDVSLGECGSWRGAELAARLAGAAGGLQGALGRVLALLPAMQADRQALRQQLAAARDANDALRQRLRATDPTDPPDQDQPSNGG